MITNTLSKIISRSVVFVMTLLLAFGGNIAHAQIWTPPAGPPPGNNAPAPIHEGSTGQGKYWSSLSTVDHALGAFYGLFDGIDTVWITAANEANMGTDSGVAADRFCLMANSESYDYFPLDIEAGIAEGFLKCIDYETGWGAGGTGTGGSGTGGSLPNGQVNGNALVWRADTNSWVSAPGLRQASFAGNGFFSFVMGDWPDALFSQIFGVPDASVGTAFGRFALNGPFFYRPDSLSDLNGDEGGTFGKILGGDFNQNYRVKWFTPSELGLLTLDQLTTILGGYVTDQELADALAGAGTNPGTGGTGSGLPNGTTDGNLLYWSDDVNQWLLSNSIRLIGGNILGLIQATLVIGQNADIVFNNPARCPASSDGAVMSAMQRTGAFGSILNGQFNLRCNDAIRIKNVYGNNDSEVIIRNIPLLEEEAFENTQVRGVCYVLNEYDGIEKGTLVDCAQLSGGELFLPGPRFATSGNNNSSVSNGLQAVSPLQANITSSGGNYLGLTNVTFQGSENISGIGNQVGRYIYTWAVPTGVQQVIVSGCAGGGSGGGGGAAEPGNSQSGGGGGGGGAPGMCIDNELIDLQGVTKLEITVGAGGRRGFGGYLEAVTNSGDAPNVCTTCGTNTNDGRPGVITKIEKFNGNISLGVPFELTPGSGGKGGKRATESANPNAGGFGGASALTTPGLNDFSIQSSLVPHNGVTGRDNENNIIENVLATIGYITNFAPNITAGGNGGSGILAVSLNLPSGQVYTFGNGQGGGGAHATSASQGNGTNLQGGQGAHGLWASGGGGGGGASGFDWMDTCAFPVSNDPGQQSGGCGGNNLGADWIGAWYSQAGQGGHGGPGFVKLSW